jgi:hypothetical protein
MPQLSASWLRTPGSGGPQRQTGVQPGQPAGGIPRLGKGHQGLGLQPLADIASRARQHSPLGVRHVIERGTVAKLGSAAGMIRLMVSTDSVG